MCVPLLSCVLMFITDVVHVALSSADLDLNKILGLFHRWTGQYDQYDLPTSLKLQRQSAGSKSPVLSQHIQHLHTTVCTRACV